MWKSEPVTIRFQFMVINLEIMQIEYFTKQKPNHIQSNGKIGILFEAHSHNSTPELNCLNQNSKRFSFDIIISFYLIAYMNTNEWENVARQEKEPKKIYTDGVPLAKMVPSNVQHTIIIVLNLGTIRLQWTDEEKNKRRERHPKNIQIHFSFLEIEKNWIILFTAVFSTVVFPMDADNSKRKKTAQIRRVFSLKRRNVVLFNSLKDERILGLTRIHAHLSVSVFPLSKKSKSKNEIIVG